MVTESPANGAAPTAVPVATWRFVVPNLLTAMVTLLGLGAMYMAWAHPDRRAAILLLAAGAFDAVDGVVARKLGGQSRFGNVFDSMSDLIAFGIAPAVSLLLIGLIHPLVALLYIMAIQFRLTRFSAAPESEGTGRFFNGLASPDAVYLGILIGFLAGQRYSIGFLIAALMAVYPGPLWPKGMRLIKLAVAAVALWLFVAF